MATPTLLSVSHADGTRDLSGNIVMTFDVAIAPGEGDISIHNEFGVALLREDVGAALRVRISGNTLVIDPPLDLDYGSRYGLAISTGALKNAQTGTAITTYVSYWFATGLIPHAVRLKGGGGDDRLIGSDFDDVLWGGAGRNSLFGHAGDDALIGGPDYDALDGGPGNDYLDGGDGGDILHGSGGSDTLLGGDGNDILYGDAEPGDIAHLVLVGGAGNDRLYLYGGTGLLQGGTGDDRLVLTHGSGTLDGDEGQDQIYLSHADGPTTVRGGGGRDTFIVAPGLQAPVVIADFMAGNGGDILDPTTWLYVSPALTEPALGVPPAAFLYTAGHLRLQQDGADTLVQIDSDGELGRDADLHTVAILRNTQVAALTSDNITQGVLPEDIHPGVTLAGGAGDDRLAGGQRDDALAGGGGNDRVDGGDGNDFLDGGDGNDILSSGAGNDAVYGGAGGDTLEGGAGDDVLDGDKGPQGPNGQGIDRAIYDTQLAGVRITHNFYTNPVSLAVTEDWQVRDTSGALGTDVLTHIERLVFRDRQWALDVGPDGNAGKIYRLYNAAFKRQPDIEGFSYWLHKVDNGMEMRQVADSFVRSDEFRHGWPGEPTSADVVALLYRNVLQSWQQSDSFAYWVDILDRKLNTASGLLLEFSERAENQVQVASLIGNGIEYLG